MTDYEGYTTGEITIHQDRLRMSGQWYAKVPLYQPGGPEEPVFRKLLARQSALEVKLRGPGLIKAIPTITAELQRIGISTTTLRIKPYQK